MLILTRNVGEHFNLYAGDELLASVYLTAIHDRRQATLTIDEQPHPRIVKLLPTEFTELKHRDQTVAEIYLVEPKGYRTARIGIEAQQDIKILRSEIDPAEGARDEYGD